MAELYRQWQRRQGAIAGAEEKNKKVREILEESA